MALKQSAKQSTTFSGWKASNAVDGKLDARDDDASQVATCTHTEPNDLGRWNVTFEQPASITRFLIYNRRGSSLEGKFIYQSGSHFHDYLWEIVQACLIFWYHV